MQIHKLLYNIHKLVKIVHTKIAYKNNIFLVKKSIEIMSWRQSNVKATK